MPTTKPRTKRGSTRSNMLISAAEVMRERGTAGVTIDEVLARSGAPRGSVYYHFPEGRNQILAEALQWAGDTIAGTSTMPRQRGGCSSSVDSASSGSAARRERLHRGLSRRRRGNRLRERGAGLTSIASGIFGRWRDALTRAFISDGFDEAEAESLAITCIASLEGAVVLCRSIRNAEPLRQVASQMEFLIKSREFVRRNGLPTVRRPLSLSPTRADEVAVDAGLDQLPFRVQGQQPPARSERARRVADDHLVDRARRANCAAASPPPTTQTS